MGLTLPMPGSGRQGQLLWLLLAAIGPSGVPACTGLEPARRQEGPAAERETHSWMHAILARGQSGDWLAIRGYHAADHLVAGTTNAPLSHAAILDLDRTEVIEAVAPRVRVVTLREFLDNAHRVVLLRPHGATMVTGAEAAVRARSKVGAKYDFLGTVGAPDDQKLYCSELCAWSVGMEVDRKGPTRVLHPAKLDRYAEVLFDSQRRDGKPEAAGPQGR